MHSSNDEFDQGLGRRILAFFGKKGFVSISVDLKTLDLDFRPN